MASENIGVLVSAVSGRVYAVINPDDETELDNPRWLLLQTEDKEPVRLAKVPRGDYMGALSLDQVAELVRKFSA